MAQTCLFKARAVLQTPLSESIGKTFCFLKPPQFSFFHASRQIKDGCRFTVIPCMEHALLSALLWGVKEGERRFAGGRRALRLL